MGGQATDDALQDRGGGWAGGKAKPGARTAPRVDRSGEVGRRHFDHDLSGGKPGALTPSVGGDGVRSVSENGQSGRFHGSARLGCKSLETGAFLRGTDEACLSPAAPA